MTALNLSQVRKSYGATEVIHGVDLEINEGEFIVFVGPSGCGKSTLLRMIAGLEAISGGTLEIDGQRVNDVSPSKRGIAMVFQSYALYPHMSVYNNMSFGLKIAKLPKQEVDRRVREAASILQLEPYLNRLPRALSGGQRQRVAIGRAICRDPKVFLFDEPLSNLDAALRVATRIEIARLHESMPGSTMIYVTHDQVEAMTLADRIVVLSDGYIEQVGPPIELYQNPANLFVAQFIGSPAMNIVSAKVSKTGKSTTVDLESGGKIVVPMATEAALKDQSVFLGFRPEDMSVSKSAAAKLQGEITLVESLGEITNIYVDVAGSKDPVVVKVPGISNEKRGDRIKLSVSADKLHLFDGDGKTLRR